MNETSVKKWNKSTVADFLINNAIYVVLLLLVIVIICMDSSFLSVQNFKFIITQASTRVILALGVAGLLVLAGTDLSVGRMVGLSAVISASLLQAPDYARRIFPDMPQLPVFAPILLAILCTAIASTISGYVIAKFKVTAFIVTLSMQLIIYGVASLYYDYTGGSPIANLDERFKYFAQGSLRLGPVEIPFLVIYAAITVAIVWFIWNKTRLGKNMFAVGGNEEAATVSGVNVIRTIVLVSMLAGILYGFAGSLEVARTGSATNNIGNGYELDAIAACVVGGVSFNGGVGSIAGVVSGVLMFQVINYGLNYVDVSPYIQYIIKGLIIVIAVAIDTRKYIKKK
ncbi:galactose/methyl galactoside ABC transporter permease MglC [Niameybacter massiliensis]|uniref:Galactose/methyl galactoside ABC transporter permease MglC n=1 Tax=Holtiella tumoricola TaxID=3018743 RepID=A0AA42DMK2_9FIRM|nr:MULTISPECIES: galactose/methyl galactoside ABC transporter permease MglC [Lachnospirales]MDA3731739.1 galactose/methyl galactoside ABC transporter permease MglC [Holtiella tumoricola]